MNFEPDPEVLAVLLALLVVGGAFLGGAVCAVLLGWWLS
jgi:hypothetical protein